MPDDAPWIDPVVVPDDLRDLQQDIEAYHREQRHLARRRRVARLTGTRAWRRILLPAGITVCALALATIVFTVLTFGQPRPQRVPAQAPVATAPGAPVGELGGLLPDVAVRTGERTISIRDLRPALVALVPLECGCDRLLAQLASQADEVRVPLVVVAPASTDEEIADLAGRMHRGRVIPVFDGAGRLAAAYDANGVTALGLSADATLAFLRADVAGTDRLEQFLQQMVSPTLSLSGPATDR